MMSAKEKFSNALKMFQRGLYSESREAFIALKKQDKDVEKYIKVCDEILRLNNNGSIQELVQIRRDVFKEFDSEFEKLSASIDEEKRLSSDLTRLILNDQKNFTEKLKSVYQSAWHSGATIALKFKVTPSAVSVSFLSKGENSVLSSIKDNLVGQFPGTKFSDDKNDNSEIPEEKGIGVLSCVPSFITDSALTQGMESVFNGIRPTSKNNSYEILILAKSVNQDEILRKRQEICDYISILSPYQKKNVSSSESNGKTTSNGFNAGLMVFGLPVNPSIGLNRNKSYSTSYTEGESYEITNYAIKHAIELLQKQVLRFDNGISYGMWQTCAYVTSSSLQTIENVIGSMSSIVSGKESYVEVPFTKVFDSKDENIKAIRDSINCLNHPLSADRNFISYLSSYEMAQIMSLPRKSVPGFPVTYGIPFGRDVVDFAANKMNSGDLELGQFRYIHNDDGTKRSVFINKNDLTMHAFVTGSTGKGKSNAIYQLLSRVIENKNDNGDDIKFMVIEPAKGEYKNIFGNANVYCSNPSFGKLLTINPFEFINDEKCNGGIHITEHIDRILDIFNSCWPMYAAMPAVLKDAIIKSYEECGWNLATSKNYRGNHFPNFSDVSKWIDFVIDNSSYDNENKGAYKGALKTRLNSLTNGINGRIFCNSKCISNEELFNENTIVDLSRIGSSETKSLIMGMLMIKMQEYYLTSNYVNSPLRHITVVEEAHNILKRTSSATGDVGNMVSKSVEMLANAIAEMRTYGEAFVIADQSPSLMDMSVIRNTNTKIVLGLPDQTDRELVGKAMGLSDDQIRELAKLEKGVAAIYQNNWAETVLCKFEKFPDEKIHQLQFTHEQDAYCNDIADMIVNPDLFKNYSIEEMNIKLNESNLSANVKKMIADLHRQMAFGNDDQLSMKIKYSYLEKIYNEYFDFAQLANVIIGLPTISKDKIKETTDRYLIDKFAVTPEYLNINNDWNILLYKIVIAYAIGLSNNLVKPQLEEVKCKF